MGGGRVLASSKGNGCWWSVHFYRILGFCNGVWQGFSSKTTIIKDQLSAYNFDSKGDSPKSSSYFCSHLTSVAWWAGSVGVVPFNEEEKHFELLTKQGQVWLSPSRL